MAKASNVTKYDAGGSGDNIIADGYIKTVEKIWMDSYVWDLSTVTKGTIDIAVVPSNKKLTSIEVQILTAVSQSGGTLSLGNAGNITAFMPQTTITAAVTCTTFSLPLGFRANELIANYSAIENAFFQFVTNGTTGTIRLGFNNWIQTSGTVKTIVRYV